jgi:hypothetical protein
MAHLAVVVSDLEVRPAVYGRGRKGEVQREPTGRVDTWSWREYVLPSARTVREWYLEELVWQDFWVDWQELCPTLLNRCLRDGRPSSSEPGRHLGFCQWSFK